MSSLIGLRPRSGAELLDVAFQFWRQNFQLLFSVAAISFLPVIALAVVDYVLPSSFETNVLSRIVTAASESMAWAAVIIVVSERYLGHRITPSQVISVVWTRMWTIFWANIFFWILVWLGLILFIVPGLYFFAKYFAMMPVVVLEGHGVRTSHQRAATLSEGSKWRVFGLVVVPWALYLFAFGGITSLVTERMSDITTVVFTRLLIAGVYPFLGIIATLLYHDLRFRNEGLDLDMMLADNPTQPTSA